MSLIAADSHVTLHYRLAAVIGGAERELVNTFSGAPATLQMGVGQWAPTLESLLLGLGEGEQRDFELEPGAAYGHRSPELVQTLERGAFDARVKPGVDYAAGDVVEFETEAGERVSGVLKQHDPQQAVVDFNHPLAGLPLRVAVRVIGVL
jgi:FKBP-type peptidyl-prolyl cis-trans isomerase SlpA